MKRRTKTLALVLPLLVVLAACGSAKKTAAPTTTTTTLNSTTTTPIGTPPGIKITTVAQLTAPTSMATKTGTKDLYVTERAGQVRVIRNGVLDPTPVIDISSQVSTDGERGLLGMAFAPNSQLFYVDYTDLAGTIHVTEYTLGLDGVVDMHTARDLLSIPHGENNHNGGDLQFGPDGDLYISVGDGGAEGDPNKNAQNLTVLLGKILRINPAASTTLPYTIPYDNPFVKSPGARGEIWSYGLRNPWRFSFDTKDGTDQGIWIGDVGQDAWEEVDHESADPKGGENYGWSLREGTHKEDGDKPANAVDPIYEYSHDKSRCSIVGGYVYRGAALPDMTGRYLFADYCTGQLMALTQKGTEWQEANLTAKVKNIESFGQDLAGEVYVLSLDGTVGRIDAS